MATKLVDKQGRAILAPQPGPQTEFVTSKADIVIYGGAAFSGKSYLGVLESTRNVGDPLYTAGLFRRQCTEITMAGGLWDVAARIYPSVDGEGIKGNLLWKFPSGARVEMHHLNNDDTANQYQGAAFTYLLFDELCHFTKYQFFYLITRNRPPAGCTLKSYCRATCNPEPGWVADLIQWWWDPNTGYPIKERSGVVRYMIGGQGKEVQWVSPDFVDSDGDKPKSITFIAATMDDNQIGLEADPTYRANLKLQDYVTRERLHKGNWLIADGGNMFRSEWLPVVDEIPVGMKLVRYWDFAATEVTDKTKNDPDWTAGALCGFHGGTLYIVDVQFFRESPGTTEVKVLDTATTDGHQVEVWWEEEKGSAGKFTSEYMKKVLTGFDAHGDEVTGQKVERARPWSSLAEHGKVKLIRGEWNRRFKEWAGKFPLSKRDCIDSVSGAVKVLTGPDRVFKYYISDEAHNYRSFRRDIEDFEKIQPQNIDIYLTLWGEEDGGIYGACWIWAKNAKRLRLYNEIYHPEPIANVVVADIIEKLVVPIRQKANYVTLKQAYCNDIIQTPGKNSMYKELKRYGIRLHTLSVYDEPGSVLTLNRMMANNNFWVHTDCTNADVQIRGWMYKGKKLTAGSPLARCACLITSQLRSEQQTQQPQFVEPYSNEKNRIREELYTRNDKENIKLDKPEYNYLLK